MLLRSARSCCCGPSRSIRSTGLYELPPSRRHFSGLSFERPDRSVDAEWPQDAQNLRSDSLIRCEATEGDAPLGAMVHDGALAVVAARLAAVAHVQFSAAMATSEQARENETLSFSRCRAS